MFCVLRSPHPTHPHGNKTTYLSLAGFALEPSSFGEVRVPCNVLGEQEGAGEHERAEGLARAGRSTERDRGVATLFPRERTLPILPADGMLKLGEPGSFDGVIGTDTGGGVAARRVGWWPATSERELEPPG